MTKEQHIAELQQAVAACLEWIDALPERPTISMPGFDRDWAEGLLLPTDQLEGEP